MFKYIIPLLIVYQAESFCSWIPPEQALEKLQKGNERYRNESLQFANRSQERRESTIHTQEPFAAVLCCSDSPGLA